MLGTPTDTITYAYTDPSWGDLLTTYDGATVKYDAMGNPVDYGDWTFGWKHGRQLSTLVSSSKTIGFTYDANGMRKTKRVDAIIFTYTYNGSQLTQMTRGTDILDFYYDASGTPVAFKLNNTTTYYYVTTLQGDVLLILDEDGEIVVSYDYDAWGKILAIGGSMATTLGTLNPLTYRGYVYDHETGLYYLQSRYYNPEWGRFLNADALVATGQGMLGNNMFAYCGGNPVIRNDSRGLAFSEICFSDKDPFASTFLGIGFNGGCSAVSLLATVGGMAIAYDLVERINTQEDIIVVIIDERNAKKQQEEQKQKIYIDQRKQDRTHYQYWAADRMGPDIVIGKGLTIQEASIRVSVGLSIMCANQKAAQWILIINGYRNAIGPEIHKGNGSNYYYHYHPNRSNPAHIWYYS